MKDSTKRTPLKHPPLPVPGSETYGLLVKSVLDFAALFALFTMMSGILLASWQHKFYGTLPNRWLVTLLTIGFGIYVWARYSQLLTEGENYKLGRQGEIIVGHILESLRPYGYTPIHDVLGKGARDKYFNIDHVLVGPKGVFAVETKTWSKVRGLDEQIFYTNGKLFAGSRQKGAEAISQTRRSAEWLRDLLANRTGTTWPVYGILTFPGWYIDSNATSTLRDESQGLVYLLTPNAIGKYLDHHFESSLSDEQIQQVVKSLANYAYEQATAQTKV